MSERGPSTEKKTSVAQRAGGEGAKSWYKRYRPHSYVIDWTVFGITGTGFCRHKRLEYCLASPPHLDAALLLPGTQTHLGH